MKKHFLPFVLAISLGFASCSKDDDTQAAPQPTPSLTKTQLITNKNWEITAITRTESGTTEDIYAQMDNCVKDDIYKFRTDSNFTREEGATNCSPSNAYQGTWAFTNNESKIMLTFTGTVSEVEIQELTATKLVTKSVNTVQGTTITYIATYTAQ